MKLPFYTDSKGPQKDRASVLIVSVGVLSVLVLMGITFALVSRTELAGSRTLTDRQLAEFAAQEGLEAACDILAKDDPRFDDFAEAWFTPPCPVNSAGAPQFTWNRSTATGRATPNPYHKLVYNDNNRRACYDLGWHINEDPPGDDNLDYAPGIDGVDDDGDGKIDEDINGRTPGNSGYLGYSAPYYYDDDEDADQSNALGLRTNLHPGQSLRGIDEDGFYPDTDGRPGYPDEDDDHDGQVDEDNNGYVDSDGDGRVYEDPGIPVSFGSYNTIYKDTAYTRSDTTSTNVNDDLYTGDTLINENQGGKCFQYVANWGGTRGISFNRSGWIFRLDSVDYNGATYENDGRVWEEGYGPIRFMGTFGHSGTGVHGLKHLCVRVENGAVSIRTAPNDPDLVDMDDDGTTNTTGGRPTDGYYPLWVGNPIPRMSGNVGLCDFVTYAGGRLGCNRQDNDEDSEGRIRTTNQDPRVPPQLEYQVLERRDGTDAEGMVLDEGGKINLNCHGSLYDPAFFYRTDQTPDKTSAQYLAGYLDGAMKLDSFRVSLVRFFEAYGFTWEQARCLARAIILYRYGPDLKPGRANVDDDGDHDVPCAGGAAYWEIQSRRRLLVRNNGMDDNGNWMAANALKYDGSSSSVLPVMDRGVGFPTTNPNFSQNVGWNDGVPNFLFLTPSCRLWEPYSNDMFSGATNCSLVIDEPYPSTVSSAVIEGIDDDREFDPVYPRGDDRPYTAPEQMIDALVWATIECLKRSPGDDSWTASYGVTPIRPRDSAGNPIPIGVGYICRGRSIVVNMNGDMTTDGSAPILDYADLYAEAARVYNIVKEDITVNVADLDVGKVNLNVDLWHSDMMDNDNNGRLDIPYYVNGWRRADQSNSVGGISVTTNADGSVSVARTFSNPAYPARPLPGEYEPAPVASPWHPVGRPAEEDTRNFTGAEKVAALKRAFRRAFGARNAPYVDTICLASARRPFPFYLPTDSPTAAGGGLLVGEEYQGNYKAYSLVGDFASYDPTLTSNDILGRLLRDQMWANIVDFQDETYYAPTQFAFPTPTMLVCSYPNLDPVSDDYVHVADYKARVATGNVDIFGVEGLHLNEVMLAPEIHGSLKSEQRVTPPRSPLVELIEGGDQEVEPPTNPDDPPQPAIPNDLVVGWEQSGEPNEYELKVRQIDESQPPSVSELTVSATGVWRIYGVPRGGYVVMAYGESYDGKLQVSFPATDDGNTGLGGRNGVTVLMPDGNTSGWPAGDPYHSSDASSPAFRRFHVPVRNNQGTGTNYLLDEMSEPYGFVTRPDMVDYPNLRYPYPNSKFVAIRVDADPEEGFLVRVRATSHWKPPTGEPPQPNPENRFAKFRGLRFLCPYVELVNISRKPIPVLMGPSVTNWQGRAFRLVTRMNIHDTAEGFNYNYFNTNILPTASWYNGWIGNTVLLGESDSNAARRAVWYNPARQNREYTSYIPGAHADGVFPPNFGYYVVTLSEAAYCGSFGNSNYSNYYAQASDPNYSPIITGVKWGADPEENYPVQFTETYTLPYNTASPGDSTPPTDSISDTPAGRRRAIHEHIFGLWNRDGKATGNPIVLVGRPETWDPWARTAIRGGSPNEQIHVLMAGGEIDLWAGSNSPRGTRPITTGASGTETDRYDYCAIEKTAPVVCNLTPRNNLIAQFAPVNAQDPQFSAGVNAAWLQVNPDLIDFQSSEAGNDLKKTLWWRSSQRNLWQNTDTSATARQNRTRLANWNKNYMYVYDAGNVKGRKYLYPGHTDDVATAEVGSGTDPNLMDRVELRMAVDNRTIPVVWDGPYPTVGWVAFVHSPWGPWKNLAPILPEERVGENDVARLCRAANPPMEFYDDNILTRLIGLSGGISIGINGQLDTAHSYRPTPFTVFTDPNLLDSQNALRPVPRDYIPSPPSNYRSTVYPRHPSYPVDYTPDWREVACVWPHGRARHRININTASMPVLAAVFDTATAANIIANRPYRDPLDVLGFSGFPFNNSNLDPRNETPEIRRRLVYQRGATVQLFRNNHLSGPFFTKNAYCTFLKTMDPSGVGTPKWTADTIASPGAGARTPPLDYDDSGAGYLLDDLADDVAERMEWFCRYWNVIDIKSRYFTVISRGRVFGNEGLLAEARLRAIVERQDVVNALNAPPLSTLTQGGDTTVVPTPGADGITELVRVRTRRFITEY